MTLPASGPLSLSQIQTEMGGSNPISLSEYYKNGGIVRSTLPTGGAINTNVPTSGAIAMSNFYNGQGVFVWDWIITGTGGNFNLRDNLITYGWDTIKPVLVTVTVNSGVTVYGYGYGGTAGFTVPSGFPAGSSITVTNNGTIAGYGGYGVASGSAGGDGGVALNISSATTLINNGAILGGGGGGGAGGSGPDYGQSRNGYNGGAGGDAILRYADLLLTNNGIIGGGSGGGGGGGRTGTDIQPAYGGPVGGSVRYIGWGPSSNGDARANNGIDKQIGRTVYDSWSASYLPLPTGGSPAYMNDPGHGEQVYGGAGGTGGSLVSGSAVWAENGYPGAPGSGPTEVNNMNAIYNYVWFTPATPGSGGNAGRAINAYGGTLAVVTYGTIYGSYA